MKNWQTKLVLFIVIVLSIITMIVMVGCDLIEDNTPVNEQTEFVIQYNDDDGAHIINVTKGMPYSIEKIPEKFGYEFLGLFDEIENGTMYVLPSGSSLSVFNDNANIILFPQFKPLEYNIILDYGVASSSGDMQPFKVDFGSTITNLPLGLQVWGKEFRGWNTKKDGSGIWISSADHINTINNKVDKNLVNKCDDDRNIVLYAIFKTELRNVKLFTSDGLTLLYKGQVEHGTHINKVHPKVFDNLMLVKSWSCFANSTEVYDGYITEDSNFYVVEYVYANPIAFEGKIRTGEYKVRGSGRYCLSTFTLTRSIKTLLDEGFSKLRFSINYDIKEVDNCNQHIFLQEKERVLYKEIIQHGGSAKLKEWRTHNMTYEVNIDELTSSVFEFKVQADNAMWKDFYVGTISVKVIAS